MHSTQSSTKKNPYDRSPNRSLQKWVDPTPKSKVQNYIKTSNSKKSPKKRVTSGLYRTAKIQDKFVNQYISKPKVLSPEVKDQ